MAIYTIPKPSYTAWQWTKSIGSRIIFPPVLLWDFAKWGINKLAGEAVSHLVLPAQDDNYFPAINADELNHDNATLLHETHQVVTHDRATLDTLQITPRAQENTPDQDKKYIINFVGNGMAYEQIIDEMQDDAQTLNRVVIGFNLRGVSNSEGQAKSKDDLVTDGIAQVQRLLTLGVPAQNITLKAHSLGGGIASQVAYHFHQQGQHLNLFSSRSFSSITNFVVGQIRTSGNNTGHHETFGKKLLGWIAKPFIKFGVSLVKWEINADDAYKAIPEEYKDYTLVRTEKAYRDLNIQDDPVIPHYASIHNALKSERSVQKGKLDKLISDASEIAQTGAPGSRAAATAAVEQLNAARASFKDRKMTTTWGNGHAVPLQELRNRSNRTGQEFFRAFVQRADADHGINAHPALV